MAEEGMKAKERKKKKSDRRNVSAQEGHAVIRKTCGPLTSPANELSWQPLSPLQRPCENTRAR